MEIRLYLLQNRSSNRCASTRHTGEAWGRTFQQYPQPLIHILRELLCIYLPQECRVGNVIASPGDVFTWLNGDTSRDGLTKVTGDCRAGVPTLKLQAQFVWPGVRWSNACWTGHHHADGRKSSLLARCWFAHAGQMSARQDKTMNMVNPCAVE